MKNMFNKKSDTQPDQFSRYTDPTGEFTNRTFEAGEWFVINKLKLRKIFLTILTIWSIGSVLFGLGYWGYYFTTGYFNDQRMMNQQVLEIEDYESMHAEYGPKDLVYNKLNIYQTVRNGAYDFVVEVQNPNDKWLANITYKFTYSNGETATSTAVILPGVTRPLVYLGQEKSSYPSQAQLKIENIDWQKIDPHEIFDTATFIASRQAVSNGNFEYKRASVAQNVPNNTIKFDIRNDSSYSYWEADYYVELYDMTGPVGMTFLRLDEFRTGETRNIDIRSYIDDLYVEDIKIYPITNVFDKEIYIKLGD